MNEANIIELSGYSGGFRSGGTLTPVLEGVTFAMRRNAMTAIVGETGSGKSLTALSMLGITPSTFERSSGELWFQGHNLFEADERTMRTIRGAKISMVFQDARAALNPVFTVGHQLRDVARVHQALNKKDADEAVEHMLERVSIPEPRRRMKQYPHEFSGGMAQRVMLAMALICRPELLVLDEPTTGLDVTIQADIMALIVELSATENVSTCLITHDLGVVAETCDDVIVMRGGRVRETASCREIFTNPQDSYTQALIEASLLVESAA